MEILYNALLILVTGIGDVGSRLLRARAELRVHGNPNAIPADFRDLYNRILEELGQVEELEDDARSALARRIFGLWSEVNLASESEE